VGKYVTSGDRRAVRWVVIVVAIGIMWGMARRWPLVGVALVVVYLLGRLVPRRLRWPGWTLLAAIEAALWRFQHTPWAPWAMIGFATAFAAGMHRWPRLTRGGGFARPGWPPPQTQWASSRARWPQRSQRRPAMTPEDEVEDDGT